MNDLRNGILDINGFLLTPETTVEDIEAHFGIKVRKNRSRSHFDLDDRTFINNEIEFKINASFESKLIKVELYPQFPEIAAKYKLTALSNDWLAYYQELRVILDNWLEQQLGKPTRKNSRNTTYEVGNMLINTCAYIDERDPDFFVQGGRVTIWYE